MLVIGIECSEQQTSADVAGRCCWPAQMLLADVGRRCWPGRCCWQNGAAPEIERMVALLDQVRASAEIDGPDAPIDGIDVQSAQHTGEPLLARLLARQTLADAG